MDATASTNPLGVATYLAEIRPNTDIADLASDIVETFRADLSDGVIQQSLLHFNLQYAGTPPGLPEMVLAAIWDHPRPRTPPNVSLDGLQIELYAATAAGVDFYTSLVIDDRANRSSFTHAGTGKDDRGVHSLLCAVPSENDWMTE